MSRAPENYNLPAETNARGASALPQSGRTRECLWRTHYFRGPTCGCGAFTHAEDGSLVENSLDPEWGPAPRESTDTPAPRGESCPRCGEPTTFDGVGRVHDGGWIDCHQAASPVGPTPAPSGGGECRLMAEWTPEALAAEKAREDAEWAAGRCPYTGYERHRCHIFPCDCFDSDNCDRCYPK